MCYVQKQPCIQWSSKYVLWFSLCHDIDVLHGIFIIQVNSNMTSNHKKPIIIVQFVQKYNLLPKIFGGQEKKLRLVMQL